MRLPKNYLAQRKILESRLAPTASPLRVTAKDGDASKVYIYDEIGVWGVNSSDFTTAFNELPEGAVDIHINSPGGDVFDGLAIYNTIKHSDRETTVYIDGLAASAASFIAMAADKVVMGRNSRMMIHDASTMTYGNAADHEETAAWLNEESDNLADIYAQRAGGKATEWRDTMRAETWYGAQAALEAGLIDSIQGADASAIPALAASALTNASPAHVEDEIDYAAITRALKEALQ
jgi:ATP-dependent protease ClpP protease subunit